MMVRVYWEDTDAGGIVYYANYLRFAERARSELVRLAGLDQAALLCDHGIAFAVRRCEIDYRAPARLDDLLCVVTRVERLGGASIAMRQEIFRDETPIVGLLVDLVSVNRDLQPVRLPPEVRATLAQWQAGDRPAATAPAA
ncbi:MAG: tol-pal system-associated acyl-CoA thioesterase [Rhodospirillaceae bacterium]|nr:tol-pal system-associated acyl-CoA thioesterase [Rhodospirillaceae bacterium]